MQDFGNARLYLKTKKRDRGTGSLSRRDKEPVPLSRMEPVPLSRFLKTTN